jgi:hypothetical protein
MRAHRATHSVPAMSRQSVQSETPCTPMTESVLGSASS